MRNSGIFAGIPIGTALLVGVAACADGGASAPREVPVREGSIDLEIGEVEGEDPYLFTTIGSVVEDERGRMIVADYQTHEVRVFEPDGRFAFSFGGQGEGPGSPWVTETALYGTTRDSLDVWRAARVRFTRIP